MTYPGVARAFGRGLKLDEGIAAEIAAARAAKGLTPTEAQNRMALFPDPCRLLRHPNQWVPTVVVDRVLVFPGIPALFRAMLDDCIAQGAVRGTGPLHTARVRSRQSESQLAAPLATIAGNVAAAGVKIGSYPKSGYVLLTLEGADPAAVAAAAAAVRAAVDGFDDE
jgi:molybdopterin-biosynthesis enzyme MoeA-like protein